MQQVERTFYEEPIYIKCCYLLNVLSTGKCSVCSIDGFVKNLKREWVKKFVGRMEFQHPVLGYAKLHCQFKSHLGIRKL